MFSYAVSNPGGIGMMMTVLNKTTLSVCPLVLLVQLLLNESTDTDETEDVHEGG